MEKNVEGSGDVLIWTVLQTLAWRNWEKPRKTSNSIASF